jgi:serine-type D-Ala-D-Ala carboxypeptidase (penicillin-binding protein 5/6)
MYRKVVLSVLAMATFGVCASSVPAATRKKAAVAPATTAKPAYIGAIVVDAASGRTLFEDQADAAGHPASVVKLMDMLIILERIEAGTVKLTDPVTITAEASQIGGSQVYLKEKEVFSVDELLYAMMIQSANDAATALAIHVAGSKDAFVDLMNQHAQGLGMRSTLFHSVHGLPPGKGQEHNVSSARDLAVLSLALLKHPDILRYTSARERPFRPSAKEPFIMRTHNHLLGYFDGCDGLKTGYYTEGGYTIVATAQRNGTRVVAVVVGSPTRPERDAKAKELLTRGFATLSSALPPTTAASPAAPAVAPAAPLAR